MRKLALHWQILIAIILAFVAGLWMFSVKEATGSQPGVFGIEFITMFDYVGTLFLNALKMIIVPLITSSIIVGVAGIGSGGNLGSLGGKTLLFYAATTLAAILIGLFVINTIQPGLIDGQPAKEALALTASVDEVAAQVGDKGVGDVAEIFVRMIPTNIVKAAADGQMLGLIFFAILFGYFMTHLSHDFAEPLFKFWNGIFHVMMKMTEFIMKFAPIGVFGLVGAVIAEAGLRATGPLAMFAIAVLLALALHAFGTLLLLLRFVGRVNPLKTLVGASQAMLTAFSTASSSATLPITMESVEENIGVSNKVSAFVLPLGATVNMNGTALYECAAALFLAQAYGLELTFGVQFTIVAIALMTSIGVLMVFDRILDMCRTSINVWGDCCCATIVARLEGEKTKVAL
jgi:proton glutamate symport protein